MKTEELKNRRNSTKNWIAIGLILGINHVYHHGFNLSIFKGDELTLKNILITIPIWTIVGLGFGYLMKLFNNQSDKKYSNQQ